MGLEATRRYNELCNVIETRVLDTPMKRIPARLVTTAGAGYFGWKAAELAIGVGRNLGNASYAGFHLGKACWTVGKECLGNQTTTQLIELVSKKACEQVPFARDALLLLLAGGATFWLAKKALPIFSDISAAIAERRAASEKKTV